MTERPPHQAPPAQESAAPVDHPAPPGVTPARPAEGRDEIPRQSLLELLPSGTVTKVLLLVALMAGILYLRTHATDIARSFSRTLTGTPAAAPR